MLYVQFDQGAAAATDRAPPAGVKALLRARRIGDVLDGLELRAAEPAIMFLRCAVVLALGPEAIARRTWDARGLDTARGFSLTMGSRGTGASSDARFPLGIAAFAADGPRLAAWLARAGVAPEIEDDVVSAGDHGLAGLARAAARETWPATLASDKPYLELLVRLGHPGSIGGLWAAATRRGTRFQVEMVARLPGLPPLHVIARDPPEGIAEVLPPGHEPPVPLRRSAAAQVPLPALAGEGPPSWDEPGPCDCGVPPDLCAMKRFRLPEATGAAPSPLPGADVLRQLTAALVDLHEVRASEAPGLLPGDRVLLARSPESIAALAPEDTVLDAAGVARAAGDAAQVAGGVLAVVPWPAIFEDGAFRRTFSGLF